MTIVRFHVDDLHEFYLSSQFLNFFLKYKTQLLRLGRHQMVVGTETVFNQVYQGACPRSYHRKCKGFALK